MRDAKPLFHVLRALALSQFAHHLCQLILRFLLTYSFITRQKYEKRNGINSISEFVKSLTSVEYANVIILCFGN